MDSGGLEGVSAFVQRLVTYISPFAGASLWSHAKRSGANCGVAARERFLIKEILALCWLLEGEQ